MPDRGILVLVVAAPRVQAGEETLLLLFLGCRSGVRFHARVAFLGALLARLILHEVHAGAAVQVLDRQVGALERTPERCPGAVEGQPQIDDRLAAGIAHQVDLVHGADALRQQAHGGFAAGAGKVIREFLDHPGLALDIHRGGRPLGRGGVLAGLLLVPHLQHVDLAARTLHALLHAEAVLLAPRGVALERQPAGFHLPGAGVLALDADLVRDQEVAHPRPALGGRLVQQYPLLLAEFLDAHHLVFRVALDRLRTRHLEFAVEQRVGALHRDHVELRYGLALLLLGHLHRRDRLRGAVIVAAITEIAFVAHQPAAAAQRDDDNGQQQPGHRSHQLSPARLRTWRAVQGPAAPCARAPGRGATAASAAGGCRGRSVPSPAGPI